MAELLLNVRDLHAGYGRAEVLHGLNITARAGKVITVIGPNGAGKSTLLNALMGVLPSRGAIEYDGAPVGLLTLEERVMLGMALVPETRALFGSMPVEDNLLLGGYRQVRLGRGAEGAAALDGVFELFPRLKERRTQLAGTLSGGERQMLAVARALMGKPVLLMLDEPSLGLAPAVVETLYEKLAQLHRDGLTLLLAEQSVPLALEIADYAYVLQTGRTVLEGKAADLARDDEVQRIYLGIAAA